MVLRESKSKKIEIRLTLFEKNDKERVMVTTIGIDPIDQGTNHDPKELELVSKKIGSQLKEIKDLLTLLYNTELKHRKVFYKEGDIL